MQKKLRLSWLAAFALGLFFSTSNGFAHNAPDDCDALLQSTPSIPGSYMHYVQKSVERRGSSSARHPEFLNPQKERQLAQLWKGEELPPLLSSFLPEGVRIISHQLKKASAPGVVKVEQPGGEFLILRVDMPFKGRVISTNVTVTAQALYQNWGRPAGEPRWLIGPDATAALDWGHGGGTKTTGGHTADTLMNYMSKYNVFTIGMDQPFHGEGPREWFENDEEYFEFRVAFRNRFIHPDVPTFLVGHSFGGLIGDMAVRRSGPGYERLGLKKAYAGVIPLSFVADPKPGGSFEEKTMKERAVDAERKWDANEMRVNVGDLNLFASLMSQDKCSALSGLQCSQTSLYNNWTHENLREKALFLDEIPSTAAVNPREGFRQAFEDFLKKNPQDLEKGPLPSLYFMGEHDALYVLHEDNIETYVRRLQNAILWTVSSRVSFRGEVDKIGHMIFDHYVPKKDHPEAEKAMRSYLQAKGLEAPESSPALLKVFREKVLSSAVQPLTFHTPVNNYSTSYVLMAYQWVPDFKDFLDHRIESQAKAAGKSARDFRSDYLLGYSEKEVFETYSIIRDFIAAVLKLRGRELTEVTPKMRIEEAQKSEGTLGNSREAMITFMKTYVNNMAFREFVEDLSFWETNATHTFRQLNEIGQTLANRFKMLETIRKDRTSPEEKVAQIQKLGPIVNDRREILEPDDIDALKESVERINLIRNKKYIPEGDGHDEAIANIDERARIQIQIRDLEKARDEQKKKFKSLRDNLSKKESQLHQLTAGLSSPELQALEENRKELYDKLESYDLKQRDLLESYMVKILNSGASWRKSFDELPSDLQQLFIDAENASANYQSLLKTIESVRLAEALGGELGPEAQHLANEIYAEGGLQSRVQALASEVDTLEYIEIGNLREKHDQLLADYVQKIVPFYFTAHRVHLRDILKQNRAETEDGDNSQLKEQFKVLEKALTMWRSRVLISKPSSEASSLY